MANAAAFLALQIGLGFLSMLPAKLLTHGLWVSVPLLFASVFVSFSITMALADGKLSSFADVRSAAMEGSCLFLRWSIYMAIGTAFTGLMALYAHIT